jgi:hypothetical protein
MTKKALSAAKFGEKEDPEDFKSVVSFLTRVIIERRLSRNLFVLAARVAKRGRKVIRLR